MQTCLSPSDCLNQYSQVTRTARVLAMAVLTASCVSARGEKVILTYESDDVRDCRLLKRLHESAGTWALGNRGGWGDASTSWNENEMRNDTAELGGNVVLAINASRGEAYLCPDETVARLTEGGAVKAEK